jgi:hypothetical protein
LVELTSVPPDEHLLVPDKAFQHRAIPRDTTNIAGFLNILREQWRTVRYKPRGAVPAGVPVEWLPADSPRTAHFSLDMLLKV